MLTNKQIILKKTMKIKFESFNCVKEISGKEIDHIFFSAILFLSKLVFFHLNKIFLMYNNHSVVLILIFLQKVSSSCPCNE